MPLGLHLIKYFTFFILTLPIVSWANAGRVKGEIEYIRVHEEGHSNGNWSPPIFWFSLKGVNNAGDCPVWSGSNTILFVAKGEMFYSMLLAAQAQDKK